MSAPASDRVRLLRLAALAFVLGMAATALGASNLSFLYVAYLHGGL